MLFIQQGYAAPIFLQSSGDSSLSNLPANTQESPKGSATQTVNTSESTSTTHHNSQLKSANISGKTKHSPQQKRSATSQPAVAATAARPTPPEQIQPIASRPVSPLPAANLLPEKGMNQPMIYSNPQQLDQSFKWKLVQPPNRQNCLHRFPAHLNHGQSQINR